MNIEIANRLYQYRRKNNLSQEELADKLGISRQAVSKWERAEASPDTDNLINLAKIYGISLDELLNTDPKTQSETKDEKTDADTDDSSTVKKEKSNTNVIIGKDGIHVEDENDTVHINLKGVHINDGDESVHIGLDGIHITDKDGSTVFEGKDVQREHKFSFGIKPKWADVPIGILAVIAYLVMGSVWGLWHPGWLIFLMIPIINGIIDAIIKRNLKVIPYPVVATVAYLFIGTVFNLWHPGWIIFLTIPVFYWIVD